MFTGFAVLIGLLLATNLACYVFLTPGDQPLPVTPRSLYRLTAQAAYGVAFALALFRVPFGQIPFACKLAIFAFARPLFDRYWRTNHLMQLARVLGDFANWFLTAALMALVADRFASGLLWALVSLSAVAEAIRLILEKGQMLTSAAWQTLPHRRIAAVLGEVDQLPGWAQRYRAYYALDDAARSAAVLAFMRARSALDTPTRTLFEYTRNFRIVPDDHPLEAGFVRDVAAGEVFIHRGWTSDPWLLIGMALRRGPWLFDPRYLRRPFYYRTGSNRLATLAVLAAAPYSPPYALYQLGHEIKAARYTAYHWLCRLVGWDNELPVLDDGRYPFERIIAWLDRLMRRQPRPERRALWSDEEVITAVEGRELPADAIAREYVYPVVYVEEVLLEKMGKKDKEN